MRRFINSDGRGQGVPDIPQSRQPRSLLRPVPYLGMVALIFQGLGTFLTAPRGSPSAVLLSAENTLVFQLAQTAAAWMLMRTCLLFGRPTPADLAPARIAATMGLGWLAVEPHDHSWVVVLLGPCSATCVWALFVCLGRGCRGVSEG